MPQIDAWEKEYRQPKFVSNSNEPQLDFKHFVKWLRKSQSVELEGLRVLDLGCGTGKNSIFLAERGSVVTGIDISHTALQLAKERSQSAGVDVSWIQGSMAEVWPFPSESFDLILDVMSSNSLSNEERHTYMEECRRALKPEGLMFVKALCKEGDKNAANLLAKSPGEENDTYVLPKTGITECVFSKDDIEQIYSNFAILKLERKSSYTIFSGKPFKRYFWILYLQL